MAVLMSPWITDILAYASFCIVGKVRKVLFATSSITLRSSLTIASTSAVIFSIIVLMLEPSSTSKEMKTSSLIFVNFLCIFCSSFSTLSIRSLILFSNYVSIALARLMDFIYYTSSPSSEAIFTSIGSVYWTPPFQIDVKFAYRVVLSSLSVV